MLAITSIFHKENVTTTYVALRLNRLSTHDHSHLSYVECDYSHLSYVECDCYWHPTTPLSLEYSQSFLSTKLENGNYYLRRAPLWLAIPCPKVMTILETIMTTIHTMCLVVSKKLHPPTSTCYNASHQRKNLICAITIIDLRQFGHTRLSLITIDLH